MTARDPVAVLRALSDELPPRSNLGREFDYHARRLVFGEARAGDTWGMLEAYEQVSWSLWTPDERAAFALAREALTPGGAK